MNRRAFGTLVATVALGGLSGCLSRFWNQETEQTHEVFVVNETDERRTVTVTVTDSNGDRLFRYEYRLDAQKVDESQEFTGTPATVRVTVDGGAERTLDYRSDAECQPDANVLGIGIRAERTVELFYECG